MFDTETILNLVAKCSFRAKPPDMVVMEKIWPLNGRRFAFHLVKNTGPTQRRVGDLTRSVAMADGWYCMELNSKGEPIQIKGKNVFGEDITTYIFEKFLPAERATALSWVEKK